MKFNDNKDVKRVEIIHTEDMESVELLRDLKIKWDNRIQKLEDELETSKKTAYAELLTHYQEVWKDVFERFGIEKEQAVRDKNYTLNWSYLKTGNFLVLTEKYTQKDYLEGVDEVVETEREEKTDKIPPREQMH